MRKNYTQLEVLLMTGTTFTSRNLCQKDNARGDDPVTESEKLAEACLNGLLQTILPEPYFKPAKGTGILYLWQINEAGSFLELELGEIPATIGGYLSITPRLFFSTQSSN